MLGELVEQSQHAAAVRGGREQGAELERRLLALEAQALCEDSSRLGEGGEADGVA